MVEESGIAAPACGRVLAPYYSHGMAALPPRSSRRRPRRGSLERPVSGRLYRGTWLLVGIPLLARGLQRAQAGAAARAPPALPAAFDGTERHRARLGALAALSGPRARDAPARSEPRQWFATSWPRTGCAWLRDRFRAHAARPRRAHARQPGRDRPGPLAGRDRRAGAPRRQRRGAGGERQRVRDRRADPARPLLRDGRAVPARSARSTRSSSSRPTAARSATSARDASPRPIRATSSRRSSSTRSPSRGRPRLVLIGSGAAARLARVRRDGRRAGARADGPRAPRIRARSRSSSTSASRSRSTSRGRCWRTGSRR